jgi:hypothetical protein
MQAICWGNHLMQCSFGIALLRYTQNKSVALVSITRLNATMACSFPKACSRASSSLF